MIKKILLTPITIAGRVLKIKKIIKRVLAILDSLSVDELENILELFETMKDDK